VIGLYLTWGLRIRADADVDDLVSQVPGGISGDLRVNTSEYWTYPNTTLIASVPIASLLWSLHVGSFSIVFPEGDIDRKIMLGLRLEIGTFVCLLALSFFLDGQTP